MPQSVFRRFPGGDLTNDGAGQQGRDAPAWVTDQPGLAARAILDGFWEAGTGPVYYGVLKRWTGAAWVPEPLKTWLGGTWQAKPLKRRDGSQWLLVNTTGA